MSATIILANVPVLAIGPNTEEQNGKKVVTGANATVELDPDQVKLITSSRRGQFEFASRSAKSRRQRRPGENRCQRRERIDGCSLWRRAAGGPVSCVSRVCRLLARDGARA